MKEEGSKYRSARERAENHKGGFDSKSIKIPEGMKLFKLKSEGKKTIDIVPFVATKTIKRDGEVIMEEGERCYEYTFFTHRGVGANEEAYVCLAKTEGEKCPICEARAKLIRSDDKDDAKAAAALKPSERQLFLVIDHDNREAGIQLWDVSYHLFGKQLNEALKDLDEGDAKELFYHPKKGCSLRLLVEQKTNPQNPKSKPFYSVERVSFRDREEPLDVVVADQPDLSTLVVLKDYDELKAVFNQEPPEDNDDKPSKKKSEDDDDDRPSKKKSSDDDDDDKPAKKKDADDDDDRPSKKKDADDDDDKPSKKKSSDDDDDDKPSKKKSSDDDDDDKPAKKKSEDEDWDDDKPSKKKSEDDDDDRPSKKKSSDDDDDDKPAKKKDADDENWDDDDKPAKKKPKNDD